MDPDLLRILCCPETHQKLQMADAALVEDLNRQISAGQLRNRAGATVSSKLDDALIREDGALLYPIRNHLPILLVDEGIPLTAAQT